MTQQQFLKQYTALPDEAQRQVADFVTFLRQKHRAVPPAPQKFNDLEDEPFIGMWQGRAEMEDSAAWVRSRRQSEWGEK